MKKEVREKEIDYERVLMFSDAIVAIAITLLALDLKLEVPEDHALTFEDLLTPWHKYLAFFLSFINIAAFWRKHHDFFIYIKRMDEKIMGYNIAWLFFIVTLPFATSVLSTHFGQTPAVFLYSMNILLLSLFQNFIWDYAAEKTTFIEQDKLAAEDRKHFHLLANLDVVNGLIAVVLSFFFPKAAFFLLYFKVPIFVFGSLYFARMKRQSMTTGK